MNSRYNRTIFLANTNISFFCLQPSGSRLLKDGGAVWWSARFELWGEEDFPCGCSVPLEVDAALQGM